MDTNLIITLAFVAGYWTHTPWWGAVAGMLVALGGGVLRDLCLNREIPVATGPQPSKGGRINRPRVG